MSSCVASAFSARLHSAVRRRPTSRGAHQSPRTTHSGLVASAARRSQGRSVRQTRRHMAATQPQADVALDDLLAQLMEQPELEEEDLAQRIAAIEQKSAELGWNKVTAELNDGSFNAQPLAGRLKKVTGPAASLTLGGLTFGAVQPNELELAFRPLTTEPPIFKGERNGELHAYTVTSAFSVPQHNLAGISKVVGTYKTDEANPQRLTVTFTEVNLFPELDGAAADALDRWVALFDGANPGSVDATSGRITVQLKAPASAQLDYLVMAPGWQMTRSNFGSIALLKAAA